MNKWVIILVVVTLAIGASSSVVFALTADGGGDNPEVPNGTESAGEVSPGLPSDDESLSDFGDGRVVTSIDDIDPNVCNLIHNINACDEEELEALGATHLAGSIAAGEPEPLYEDGEPQYEVQSSEEAAYQACGLAGGIFWASSDGAFGCDMVQVLEDGGEGETQAHPPLIVPKLEVPPAD